MINKIPIAIKSCEKNKIKRLAIEHTWFNKFDNKFLPIFLIGRKGKPTELVGNILYLDCGDSYLDLVLKTKEYYRWALNNTSATHFWSCDDDSYINCNIFNNYTNYKDYDYCGNFLYGMEMKDVTIDIDKKMSGIDICGYASGCTFCVSRKAAEICVETLPQITLDHVSFIEDVAIGIALNKNFKNLKKLHIDNINPWSNAKKYDNLMAGHYIYHSIKGEQQLNNYQSMKKMHHFYYEPDVIENINFKEYLSGRFNRTFNTKIEKEKEYNIQKNIHFIWIGSNIPQQYINNILKCNEINTEYNIHVWLDHEFPKQLIDNNILCHNLNYYKFINQNFIDQITLNAGKVDVMRYEIIYKYGGIYSDVDSIFLKPFDNNFNNSFVTNAEGYYNITNSCFGFNKNSKFLKFVIDSFPENFKIMGKDAWLPELGGPSFFTTCFVQYDDSNINTINQKYLIFKNTYSYSYHTMDKNW